MSSADTLLGIQMLLPLSISLLSLECPEKQQTGHESQNQRCSLKTGYHNALKCLIWNELFKYFKEKEM